MLSLGIRKWRTHRPLHVGAISFCGGASDPLTMQVPLETDTGIARRQRGSLASLSVLPFFALECKKIALGVIRKNYMKQILCS